MSALSFSSAGNVCILIGCEFPDACMTDGTIFQGWMLAPLIQIFSVNQQHICTTACELAVFVNSASSFWLFEIHKLPVRVFLHLEILACLFGEVCKLVDIPAAF